MGWLKDKLAAEPIECPRGWGEVTFARDVQFFPVFLTIQRSCPIGGVESCTRCSHPLNPGLVEELRLQLQELDGLRGAILSEEEFRIRRRMVVEAWEPLNGDPGRSAAIAALVLGPLGVLTMGAGWYLSTAVHMGFLGLAGGGLVLSSIAASLAVISRMQRRRLSDGSDLLLEESPDRTYEIEAELGRAREELRFFRELHEGEASEDSQPTERSDS
jgi:hypothetical protein